MQVLWWTILIILILILFSCDRCAFFEGGDHSLSSIRDRKQTKKHDITDITAVRGHVSPLN